MASTRQQNVASDYPEVVEKLRKSYGAWWKETVPLMVNEDRPYAAQHPQEVRYEKQNKRTRHPGLDSAEAVVERRVLKA